MCTPSGSLERWTVPRSFSKRAFRDARKSSWGDLWALGAKTRVIRTARVGDKKRDRKAEKEGEEEAPERKALSKRMAKEKRRVKERKAGRKGVLLGREREVDDGE
jgi:ribosomal protein RSM22 (predicted rRNA methylase)